MTLRLVEIVLFKLCFSISPIPQNTQQEGIKSGRSLCKLMDGRKERGRT